MQISNQSLTSLSLSSWAWHSSTPACLIFDPTKKLVKNKCFCATNICSAPHIFDQYIFPTFFGSGIQNWFWVPELMIFNPGLVIWLRSTYIHISVCLLVVSCLSSGFDIKQISSYLWISDIQRKKCFTTKTEDKWIKLKISHAPIIEVR